MITPTPAVHPLGAAQGGGGAQAAADSLVMAPSAVAIAALALAGQEASAAPLAEVHVIPNLFRDPTAAAAHGVALELIVKKPNLEIKEAPQIGTYEEITKRLKKEELAALEAFCDSKKEELEHAAAELIALVRDGKLEDIQALCNSSDPKEVFLIAFQGVRSKIVPVGLLFRVAELLAIADLEKEVLDILEEDGTINPKTRDLIIRSTKSYLTSDQQEELIGKISSMPREERLIFNFETKERFDLSLEYFLVDGTGSHLMGEVLCGKQGFNLLNFQPWGKGNRRMMASLAVFQEVLKLQFPESFVKINPVFGLSTPSQIRLNGLTQTRDVALHYVIIDEEGDFKVAELDKADGFECRETDFECHDRYHSWVTSSIPIAYKRALIHMADFTADLAKANKASIGEGNFQALKKLGWLLKDMDQRQFTLHQMLKTVDEFDADPVRVFLQLFETDEAAADPATVLGHTLATLAVSLLLLGEKKKLIDFIEKDPISALEFPPFAHLLATKERSFEAMAPFEDPANCLEFFRILLLSSRDELPDFSGVAREFHRTLRIQGESISAARAEDPTYQCIDILPEEIPEFIRESLRFQAQESRKTLEAMMRFSF